MRFRVLFDTTVVRGVIHRDSAATPLEKLYPYRETLSMAVADNSVAELALALYDARLDWNEWAARIHLVDRLLDRTSPIFPNDRELEHISIGSVAERGTALPRHEHSVAIWDLLRRAQSPDDLIRGPSFTGSDGVEYRIESSKELVTQLVAAHRDRWRNTIDELQKQIIDHHPTQDYVAEVQFKALFGGHPNEAMLRERYDGYVRTISRFFALALQQRSPYDPNTEKRRGDSFDIALVMALGLPALICTLDDRLRTHVKETGSAQVSQVLTPHELFEGAEQGNLSTRLPERFRDEWYHST
jgi:hypothetical protein